MRSTTLQAYVACNVGSKFEPAVWTTSVSDWCRFDEMSHDFCARFRIGREQDVEGVRLLS